MRKWICLILLLCLLFTACSPVLEKEIACQDIVAAYEQAGYSVFHKDPSGIDGYDCYICIEDEKSGQYIYFHRFPTAAEAKSYAETRQFNVILWFFTVIYGDPSWLHTTTYGCFEIEYEGEEIFAPFAKLID